MASHAAARVVFAIQSPTLLTRLARSRRWRLETADFGDCADLRERDQLATPTWDGREQGVLAAFVCAPAQVQQARLHLPNTPIVLVAHQAYPHKLPHCPEARWIVSFSREVEHLIRSDFAEVGPAHRGIAQVQHFAVLHPAFPPAPNWRYRPGRVFTLQSRPQNREALAHAALESIRALTKVHTRVYGQDQADGYLDAEARDRLLAGCSGYLTALHARRGFGLAEYEAMASGCPVVGHLWGDLKALRRTGASIPGQGFCEYADVYRAAELVDRIARDASFAQSVASEQLDFVGQYFSASAMDESIGAFIDRFSATSQVDAARSA